MEHVVVMAAARVAVLVSAFAAFGCGEDETADEACKEYIARAPPSEVAKTPRENMSAEVLALETDGTFLASDARYERIASELEAIGELTPVTRYIQPRTVSWTDFLDVRLTDSSSAAVHETLDCPNQAYGATVSSVTWETAHLQFGGRRFNTKLLSEEYESLPNVEDANGRTMLHDGPDVCLEDQGGLHVYIFDEASGDCTAGCMNHKFYGFTATPEVGVTSLGSYDPASAEPEPAWYTKSLACRARLTQL
jgi:hypothetical protein